MLTPDLHKLSIPVDPGIFFRKITNIGSKKFQNVINYPEDLRNHINILECRTLNK